MSPVELACSWRTFAIEGLAAWRIVVARGGVQSTLSADETLDLCAAVELERVHVGNIDALLATRKRRYQRHRSADRARWTFAELAGSAMGLTRESAPGEVSLADMLRRAGLELVRSEVRMPDGAREEAA